VGIPKIKFILRVIAASLLIFLSGACDLLVHCGASDAFINSSSDVSTAARSSIYVGRAPALLIWWTSIVMGFISSGVEDDVWIIKATEWFIAASTKCLWFHYVIPQVVVKSPDPLVWPVFIEAFPIIGCLLAATQSHIYTAAVYRNNVHSHALKRGC
jgi:hypothetical protein